MTLRTRRRKMEPHPYKLIPDVTPMVSDPGDFAIVRRTFCFWQSRHRGRGTIAWGRPNEEDVAEVCAIWDAHLRCPYGSDPTLTDLRALEWIDLFAFERLVRTFAARRAEWMPRAGQQAILHRGGYGAAVILGALQVAGQGYRIGFFDAQEEALGWLRRPELADDYAKLRASLLSEPEIVRRVRTALDEVEAPLPTGRLARRVGLSVRSLQRHLASAGTSVRDERRRHLITRAERLLLGTDFDIGAIAAMLGLDSASRLVAMFRAARNITPGDFRAANKKPED